MDQHSCRLHHRCIIEASPPYGGLKAAIDEIKQNCGPFGDSIDRNSFVFTLEPSRMG